MSSIYDLSWGETSLLSKLKLFFKSRKKEERKIRSNELKVQAEGYSVLSSTYYSIAGTALAQLRAALHPKWLAPVKVAMWCCSWLPLGAWCYWRMLPLSNRIIALLIDYDGISANQCDVRQSILRRRGRYDEAKKCIRAGLAKNPKKAHTRALLHIGLAEIYRHKGDRNSTEKEVRVALAEVVEAEKKDPRQAARIYRHCADIIDFIEKGDSIPQNKLRQNKLRCKAQELAKVANAQDQLLKL